MGGVFFVKKWKMGCFVKMWTFPQSRVHYVQQQYFLFYILLIWGCVCTQRTPPRCLRACTLTPPHTPGVANRSRAALLGMMV